MKYYLLLSFLIICIGFNNLFSDRINNQRSKHCRDCSVLSLEEQQFADQLSLAKRKVFCGKFSPAQRKAAMKYFSTHRSSHNEAVVHVMQETGMSLAVKSRRQCDGSSQYGH